MSRIVTYLTTVLSVLAIAVIALLIYWASITLSKYVMEGIHRIHPLGAKMDAIFFTAITLTVFSFLYGAAYFFIENIL